MARQKKASETLAAYVGEDKIVGRPIRLNTVTLTPRRGKANAELLFWGDVHLGHPQCNISKAKAQLDYALKNGVYVILMGDLIEAGLRDSIGDSCYQQKLNPGRQMEEMVELLEPVSKAGLIIGLHTGNHCFRIMKATSVDVSKIMAKQLGVPYLGYSCWSQLSVGSQRYSMYSTHGWSGARFKHTKIKAAMDMAAWIDSDIIAHGHVHSIAAEPVIKQTVVHGRVKELKSTVILTGSYLEWDRSYAQMANYPITKIGSPKAMLGAKDHDVHVSL